MPNPTPTLPPKTPIKEEKFTYKGRLSFTRVTLFSQEEPTKIKPDTLKPQPTKTPPAQIKPKAPIGFVVSVPIPLKDTNEYGWSKDRSPIVLARKYIKAVNALNPNYTYSPGQGITPDMLAFAKKRLRLVFVLNFKADLPLTEEAKEQFMAHKRKWEADFQRLSYPVSVSLTSWGKPEGGDNKLKAIFPPMTTRASVFSKPSDTRAMINAFKAQCERCYFVTGDADLLSLYTRADKSTTILSDLAEQVGTPNTPSETPVRLLGTYTFEVSEVIQHVEHQSTNFIPPITKVKKVLQTLLLNQLDMSTRALFAVADPKLAYFAEPNTAHEIGFFDKTILTRLLSDSAKDRGRDWTWVLNTYLAKSKNQQPQHFMVRSPVRTSSRHDIFKDKSSVHDEAKRLPNHQTKPTQLNERCKEATIGSKKKNPGENDIRKFGFRPLVQTILNMVNIPAPTKYTLSQHFSHTPNVAAPAIGPTNHYAGVNHPQTILDAIGQLHTTIENKWIDQATGKFIIPQSEHYLQAVLNHCVTHNNTDIQLPKLRKDKAGKTTTTEKYHLPKGTLKQMVLALFAATDTLQRTEILFDRVKLLTNDHGFLDAHKRTKAIPDETQKLEKAFGEVEIEAPGIR